MKEYSTYCMDNIRHELGEELENIYMTDAICSEWVCAYMWWVTYEWVDYSYTCKVHNKENVELDLEKSFKDQINEKEINNTESEKISSTDWNPIILVFSPTGNTKRMAEYISELTNIELIEILAKEPYTEEDRNWRNEESRTFKEYKDSSIRPEIENEISIDWYDTVYLWFPIWFWITPNLILTLLEKYNFSDKDIILFCTSEHVWIEKAVEYLEPYNLNVIASHRFAQDTTKEQVQERLKSL